MGYIEIYLAERDKAVASDLETFMTWASKKGSAFSSPQVAEVTQHKMRSCITALPREMQMASHNWLLERGLTSFMDGGVNAKMGDKS